MPTYTSYGPNEDNTTTLVYTYPACSDEKAIEMIQNGDIGFCSLEEINKPCEFIYIENEQGETIYQDI